MHKFLVLLVCICIQQLGVAQPAKLVLPTGHGVEVDGTVLSNDGKYLASFAVDRTLILWEAATGKQLHTINPPARLKAVWFSPDDKQIIAAAMDGTVHVWDKQSAALVATHKLSGRNLSHLYHSKKKEFLIVMDEGNNLYKYELPSFKLSGKIESSSSQSGSFVVNKEETHLLVHQDHQVVKEYRLAELSQTFAIDLKEKFNTRYINNIGYGNKDQVIINTLDSIEEEQNDEACRIINIKTGNVQQRAGGNATMRFIMNNTRVIISDFDGLYVKDAETDKTIIPASALNVSYYVIQEDSGWLLIEERKGTGFSLAKWNLRSGKRLSTTPLLYKPETLTLEPNQHRLFTGSRNGKIVAYNTNTGKQEMLYQGLSGFNYLAAFSEDGNSIFTVNSDHSIRQWDKRTAKLVRRYAFHTNSIGFFQLIKGSDKMISIGDDKKLAVWSIHQSKPLFTKDVSGISELDVFSIDNAGTKIVGRRLSGTGFIEVASLEESNKSYDLYPELPTEPAAVVISKDGSRVAATAYGAGITVMDIAMKKVLFTSDTLQTETTSPLFTNDNNKLVLVGDAFSYVLDITTGKFISSIGYGRGIFTKPTINTAGNRVLFYNMDTAYLWDITSAAGLIKIPAGEPIRSGFFVSDDRFITQHLSGTLRLWDAATGTNKGSFEGYFGADVSANGDTMITTYKNKLILYHIPTGKKIYESIVLGDNNVVVDEHSRFDGDAAARDLLYFTCGLEIVELNQVKERLWVPGLAERIIKAEQINAEKISEINICNLTPVIRNTGKAKGILQYEITARSGGLGETILLINNVEVKRYAPDQLQKTGDVFALAIDEASLTEYFVQGSTNEVSVKALTADNVTSSRSLSIRTSNSSTANKTPPALHAVVIGVSDYKGDELDLRYAAKDAGDIAQAIEAAAKKLFNTGNDNRVFIHKLHTGEGRTGFPEKKTIQQTLHEIGKQAKPNDVLLIFFAGHGVMDTKENQFFFLTADASKSSATDAIKQVGISTTELAEWIKPVNIKAQKRILVFDACNSGQAIKDLVKIGGKDDGYVAARSDEQSKQLKAIDKLNERSGLYILSASASDQVAYELSRFSQGLLTYALLKAIKQQPDILEEGQYLNVSRWFNAAEQTVTELAIETGARQQPQVVSNTNFNIGKVDAEVMAKISLSNEKPSFAMSNFQNADEAIADDDLEIGKMINQVLNAKAASGSNSPLVFVNTTAAQSNYQLTGRYEVKQNDIVCKVNIKQGKTVLHRFEVAGKVNELDRMIAEIVAKGLDWVVEKQK